MNRRRTSGRYLHLTIVLMMFSCGLVDAIGNGPDIMVQEAPEAQAMSASARAAPDQADLSLPNMSQFLTPPNQYRVLPIFTNEPDEPLLDRLDDLGVGGLVINNWNWNDTMLQGAKDRNWTLWANDYYMYPSGNANPMGGVHDTFWNPGFEQGKLGIWPDGWTWTFYEWPFFDRTGAHAHSGKGAVAADDRNCFQWPVGVMAGEEYLLTTWAVGDPGTDRGRMVMIWYNTDRTVSINFTEFAVGTQYMEYRLQAKAPAGATAVRIIIQGVELHKNVWFDDMMFLRLDPSATNLLANGGLEMEINIDGIPDGWGKDKGPTWDNTSTNSHTGAAAVLVNGTDIFIQVVPAQAGKEYVLSEWIRNEAPGWTYAQIAVLWTNDTMQVLGFTNSMFFVNDTYVNYSMPVTSPAKTEYALVVLISGGANHIWVDDVDLHLNPALGPGVTRGPVLDGHPELEAQGLYYASENVSYPGTSNLTIPSGKLVSAVAAPTAGDGTMDLGAAVDISPFVFQRTVIWSPAAGKWTVMAFTSDILYNGTEVDPALSNMHQINVMNKKAVQGFIDAMYVNTIEGGTGSYLGTTVKASFTDEVSNLAGYLIPGETYPVVAWLDDPVNGLRMTDAFKERTGYELIPVLPALYNDVGPKTAKYRIDFYETTAKLEGDAYYEMIGTWCSEHGMNFSGHLLGEESLITHVAFYGDYFESIKHMGYPGIDALLHQAGDMSTDLITPKMASSASSLYGKPHTMTEYSVSPSSMNYRNMTAAINWQMVQGIDTITSFSFYMGIIPDDELKAHSEQVGRTGYMLNQGNYSTDIAVLYPITSIQAEYVPQITTVFDNSKFSGFEHDMSFRNVTATLLSGQTDFIYINDENLLATNIARGAGNRTVLHHNVSGLDLRVLVVPEIDAINYSTMQRIRQFYDAGGIVISVGDLPFQTDENGTDPRLDGLLASMFDTSSVGVDGYSKVSNGNGGVGAWADGSVTAMGRAIKAIHDPDLSIVDGTDPAIYYMKRTAPGYNIYYLVNNGPFDSVHTYRVEGMGDPTGWNPETGEVSNLIGTDYSYDPLTGFTTVMDVPVGRFSSVFMVLKRPAIDIGPEDIVIEPATPVIGDRVAIKVNISNIGNGFASNITLDLGQANASWTNGTSSAIGKTRFTSLLGNKNITLSVTWNTSGAPGLRKVDAKVCLPPYECSYASIYIYVNTPPIVEMQVNRTEALTGEPFGLSAGNSTDIDGPLANLSWDLGDGNMSEGLTVAHSYEDDGIYDVTLTVMDSNGTKNFTTMSLTVLNRAPSASFTLTPLGGNATTLFRFDATSSIDLDGQVIEYLWELGDGTGLSGVKVEHLFSTPGNHTVLLTIRDDDGDIGTTELVVSLDNMAPVANLSAISQEGDVFTEFLLNSTSFDTDGRVIEEEWTFGDGTNASGPMVTHRYSDSGNFTITLKVMDDLGLWSDNRTLAIKVMDLPPIARATPSERTVKAGDEAMFSANATTDPDDGPVELGFMWDFGDGHTAQGMNVVHVFEGTGDYNVTLTVTDGGGASSSFIVLVHVEKKERPQTDDIGGNDAICPVLLVILIVVIVMISALMIQRRRTKGEGGGASKAPPVEGSQEKDDEPTKDEPDEDGPDKNGKEEEND